MSAILTEAHVKRIGDWSDDLYLIAEELENFGYHGLAEHLYCVGNELNIEHDRLIDKSGPFYERKIK